MSIGKPIRLCDPHLQKKTNQRERERAEKKAEERSPCEKENKRKINKKRRGGRRIWTGRVREGDTYGWLRGASQVVEFSSNCQILVVMRNLRSEDLREGVEHQDDEHNEEDSQQGLVLGILGDL